MWWRPPASGTERNIMGPEQLPPAGVMATGPAALAQYDPPWTLGFARRNEVLIPVETQAGD